MGFLELDSVTWLPMLNVGFKNCGVRTILKKCFPFFWNLNSKHYIFMPDWSVINWKQRTWVHFNLFKDDSIFYNNLISFFFFFQFILSISIYKDSKRFLYSCVWKQKGSEILRTNKQKNRFLLLSFLIKGKNPISLNSLSCHPIELGLWLTVFLYFSETLCYSFPFQNHFSYAYSLTKNLFTSKLYFEAF